MQAKTNKQSLEGTRVPSGAGPSCVFLLENTMFAIKNIAERKKQRIKNTKHKTNNISLEGTLVRSGAGPYCVLLCENNICVVKSIAKRRKQKIEINKHKNY